MSRTRRPLVIAHRGASGYRPEHTEAAYRLAIRFGVDAVEPDIVATRDGVLVLRHENEISGTTDVAARPEFAGRRVTKVIDGVELTGWFTEDFTWAELSSLRAVERLPELRPSSAEFDGRYPLLRLRDLLDLLEGVRAGIRVVAEIKHATYFDSIGLPLDELFAAEVAGFADDSLIVESFEQRVLERIRERGVPGRYIYLVEQAGSPADRVAREGAAAPQYAEQITDPGLAELAKAGLDGISVHKSFTMADDDDDDDDDDAEGRVSGPSGLVDRTHAHGLDLFCWTLRPENFFLAPGHRSGRDPADWGDWRREWRVIMSSGIDGVFADHPDLALKLRSLL